MNAAYIGDDMGDYDCMRIIHEAGGLTACPKDSVNKIKEVSNYNCSSKGGEGAVREFIEWLEKEKMSKCMICGEEKNNIIYKKEGRV